MRWISYLNVVFVVAITAIAGAFFFLPTNEIFLPQPSCHLIEKKELPKSSFALTDEAYQEIGKGPFTLQWVAPKMQLPDLRCELHFHGKNARPDVPLGKTCLYLTLKGSGETKSCLEKERIYLVYQGNLEPCSPSPYDFDGRHDFEGRIVPFSTSRGIYAFSPDNQPTPLWLQAFAVNDHTIHIKINMLDETGAIVSNPANLHSFPLECLDSRAQMSSWDLGGCRADTTLFVRQKARWIGPDRFLEMHGGDDFSFSSGKQRIDFFDGETPYSCFIELGDFLVWKNNRWEQSLESSTLGLPLLAVKKMDDKVISFELWDPEGTGKIHLSLVRSKDHRGLPDLMNEFKFVGAKTWAQFIVESRNGVRLTLRPHDWLVLTQEGWKKLDSPELVDDFVDQKIIGPLFILDKLTKKNGRQILLGHLFNTSRTEVEEVELTAHSNSSSPPAYPHLPNIVVGNAAFQGDRE